jgi:Zn-dependent protease with chaperone function
LAPPFVLLVGFLTVAFAASFLAPLPGSSSLAGVGAALLAWPVPTALAAIGLLRIRARLGHGAVDLVHPRVWLFASSAATPLVLLFVTVPGGWLDCVDAWAAGSHLGTLVLLALPLLAIELPRLLLATVGMLWLEGEAPGVPPGIYRTALPTFADAWPVLRLRLGWPLLLPIPCLAIGGLLDLLRLDRALHQFVVGTSAGTTLALLVALVGIGLLLPASFRLAFGVTPALPAPLAQPLRAVAERLGFPGHRVLLLPTGGRAVNAMLVGPLPFGRILVLTDGLLQTLDLEALSGVVAHEVGHARMGHPGLLLVLTTVLPMLWLGAGGALWAEQELMVQAFLVLLLVPFGWSVVRAVAHRFEHEADIASVRAFGAGPCTRALQAVMHLGQPLPGMGWRRLTSLHPEEPVRCAAMQRYEVDPVFRQRFDGAGRRLRRTVLAALGVSAIASAVACHSEWRFEAAIWRLASGDVVAAVAAADAAGDAVPERWRKPWRGFRETLAAAVAVAPEATEWALAQPAFAEAAFARGRQVLLADGPSAARPWLLLAADARPEDRTGRGLLYEYCKAAAEGEPERMGEVRDLLLRHGVPAGLEPVFRDAPDPGPETPR